MIILTDLSTFYRFITFEDGKIRRYLFDSNVRSFMGLNAVNEDISNTLDNPVQDEDFWWLNNGITILCSKAIPIGKSVSIDNAQIVNGLQTSECIYRHFSRGATDDKRLVLVKILPCDNPRIADDITRSTNNQTAIMSGSLRATDKLQEDIEAIMLKESLYYERRVNFYMNQGVSPAQIFSPLYLAKGYVALIRKEPYRAVSLKQRFMRKDESYRTVFCEDDDVRIWPVIARIMKRTDEYIDTVEEKRIGERFKNNVRYQLAFLTLSRLMGSFLYSIDDVIVFDVDSYSFSEIKATWIDLASVFDITKEHSRKLHGKLLSLTISQRIAEMEKIEGVESLSGQEKKQVSQELLEMVQACLPKQPWPKGLHRMVSTKLGISPDVASRAIGILMNQGKIMRQKNIAMKTESVDGFDSDHIPLSY